MSHKKSHKIYSDYIYIHVEFGEFVIKKVKNSDPTLKYHIQICAIEAFIDAKSDWLQESWFKITYNE